MLISKLMTALATALVLTAAMSQADAKNGGSFGGSQSMSRMSGPSLTSMKSSGVTSKMLPAKVVTKGDKKDGKHGKYWLYGGVTILAADYSGCGYEYYKWQSTGAGYWRVRYLECRG